MSISTDGLSVPVWDLADRLAKALRVSGVSAADMAEYLEVHRNTVGNWMNGRGKPSRPMLIAWALRTGVSFDWLKDGTAPPMPGDGPDGDPVVPPPGLEPGTCGLKGRRRGPLFSVELGEAA